MILVSGSWVGRQAKAAWTATEAATAAVWNANEGVWTFTDDAWTATAAAWTEGAWTAAATVGFLLRTRMSETSADFRCTIGCLFHCRRSVTQ